MRWWIVLLALAMLPVSAGAVDLDPICHEYYQTFKTPNLTFENAGRIADEMEQNNCWPALQNLGDQHAHQQAPTDWDCTALADDIVQQTPDIVRIYRIKPIDAEFCTENLNMFKDSQGRLNWVGSGPPDMGLYSVCGPLVGASTDQLEGITGQSAQDGPDRVLHCIGTSYGIGFDEVLYFLPGPLPGWSGVLGLHSVNVN